MKDLGFKAGLEIHQRLDTHKLFCNCKSQISQEEPINIIERTLRPVAGETGEIDRAALFEALKNKKFQYLCYPETTCLVEADEEPPHNVNKEALETSLIISKMLNCDLPDEIEFMRKTVIDGSNTSGFQRTAIIGFSGSLETSKGEIGISNICLEEEAAQILEKGENLVKYGLDRLGIPLVEIGTSPCLKDPQHVKEAAKKIGNLLRATGKVQRGIGTIRQDVNVSISQGARVEIKGLQELKTMDKVVKGEVERQKKLLELSKALKKRKASVAGPIDVTSVFKNTKNKIVSEKIKNKGKVFAFVLKDFSGLLNKKICFEKTFGEELVDYTKSHGIRGFIHSDEDLGSYNLTREFLKLKGSLKTGEKDVIGIISGDSSKSKKAASSLVKRAKKALEGVPEETRCANPDLTTSYLRPLPGEARMYPETDVKPIPLTKELLDLEIPESLEEKKKKFIQKGLSKELADQIVKSPYLSLFEESLEMDTDHKKVANILVSDIRELKRQGVETGEIKDSKLKKMFLKINKIPNEAIPKVITKLSEKKTLKQALGSIDTIKPSEVDKIIEKYLDKKLIKKEGMHAFKKLMGQIMSETRGKIDGKIVAKKLKKKIKEISEN